MRNKVGNMIYVSDLETSATDVTREEVFAYACGLMEVNSDEMIYKNNIVDYVALLRSLPTCTSTIYFHNLSFDIEFLLNYLVNEEGFTQIVNQYENNRQNIKRKKPRRFIKKNEENMMFHPHEKTFESVYANGTYYQVTLYLEEDVFYRGNKKEKYLRKIVFKDSYKIVAYPLKKIAKDFLNFNMPKDGINHSIIRPKGYILNNEEYKYLYDDVKVLKDFVNLILVEGIEVKEDYKVILDKMTIASQTLCEYKHLLFNSYYHETYDNVKAFSECFTTVEMKEIKETTTNQNLLFESVFPQYHIDVDGFIRRSYFGGIVYKHNENIERFTNLQGLVFDVNSLYPSVMRSRLLPYGHPKRYNGNYKNSNIDKEEYPLYIQEIEVQIFELKEGFIPNIQIRGSFHFKGTEYAKNNKYIDSKGNERYETCSFVFTNVQLERFLKSYEVVGIKYIRGYAFKGSYGLFDDYIDTFMEMKKNGKGARRETAKLFLNSLYGKFGTNPKREERIIKYENGIFGTSIENDDGTTTEFVDKGVYLPLACFITAYAREVLLSAIEKVHDRFLYADTDSIHIQGFEIPDIEVHDKNLGAWKLEGKFINARYVGAKRYAEYMEKIDKEGNTYHEWDIKCCGLSREVMEKISIDVFHPCELLGKDIKKIIDNLYTKDNDVHYYWDKECSKKVIGLVRSKKKKYVKGGIDIKEQPYMINDKYLMLR